MSKLFISYRRDDSADATGRLHDRLKGHFGREAVFLDIDAIPLGVDFRKCLADAVNQCDVLLAVIGDHWLDRFLRDGPRKARGGWMTLRTTCASRSKRPWLGAFPWCPCSSARPRCRREADLPDGLKELAYRNAAEVRSGPDFHSQVDRLIRGLEELLARKRELGRASRRRSILRAKTRKWRCGRARDDARADGPRRLRTEVPRTARHPSAGEPHPATGQGGVPPRPVRCRRAAPEAQRGRHRSLGRDDRSRATSTSRWRNWRRSSNGTSRSNSPIRWAGGPPGRKAGANRSRARRATLSRAGTRIAVVPKGLRSFDANDSDFFLAASARPARQGRPARKHPLLEAPHRGQRRADLHGGRDLRPQRLRQVVAGQGRPAAPPGQAGRLGLRRGHRRRDRGPAAERAAETLSRPGRRPGSDADHRRPPARAGLETRPEGRSSSSTSSSSGCTPSGRSRIRSWPGPCGSATASTSSASSWCGTTSGSP